MGILWEIIRKSIRNLWNLRGIYRKSSRKSEGNLKEICRKSIRKLLETYRKSTRKSIGNLVGMIGKPMEIYGPMENREHRNSCDSNFGSCLWAYQRMGNLMAFHYSAVSQSCHAVGGHGPTMVEAVYFVTLCLLLRIKISKKDGYWLLVSTPQIAVNLG